MSEQKNKNIFIKISQGFFKTDLGIFIFFVPLYLIWVLSSTASLLKNYNNLYLLILGITLTFIVLSYFYWQAYKDKQNKYKLWILTLFFVFFLGIFGLEINQRFDEKITANYHDSLPQIETSIDYFLAGKNPYQENYYGTPLEDYDLYRIIDVDGKDTTYHQLNPAFENYVYPPAQFILAAPFKLASEKIFGFYDHRFFILIFFILSLFVVYCLPKSDEKKLSLLIIYIFNPFF